MTRFKIDTYIYVSTNNTFTYTIYPVKGKPIDDLHFEFDQWVKEDLARQEEALFRTFEKDFDFFLLNGKKKYYAFPYKNIKESNSK